MARFHLPKVKTVTSILTSEAGLQFSCFVPSFSLKKLYQAYIGLIEWAGKPTLFNSLEQNMVMTATLSDPNPPPGPRGCVPSPYLPSGLLHYLLSLLLYPLGSWPSFRLSLPPATGPLPMLLAPSAFSPLLTYLVFQCPLVTAWL